MNGKVIAILSTLACLLALTAGAAQASPLQATQIVFDVENAGDGSAQCPGALFGLSFDMVSPGGALLGTGVSCIAAVTGCDPSSAWRPGCQATLDATFVLDFAGGSITAPVRLHEEYPSPSAVRQQGVGKIAGGTGAYAGAAGTVDGGGTVDFAVEGSFEIAYTVHVITRGGR
jgi:hypothetical protein